MTGSVLQKDCIKFKHHGLVIGGTIDKTLLVVPHPTRIVKTNNKFRSRREKETVAESNMLKLRDNVK